MAEIGSTLREARMRQRIDITDMETRTKIRAKYLRALENEEWDLLPGPTYVRSFLRTYAEALDLDAKLLVEEFKLRHDPMDGGDLQPMRRPSQRERDRRRAGRPRRGFPRGAAIAIVLALIVGALYLVGRNPDDPEEAERVTTMQTETEEREPTRTTERRAERRRPARSRVVRLQIVPTAPVSVCLVNINGDVLIANETLTPGNPSRTFRSKRFRLVLGNNGARLRINGRARPVPATPGPIGFTITRAGRSDLPVERRPDCS